jgi:hypothetical protein
MTPTLLSLTLALFLPAETPSQKETPRKPNPLAPSLPLLSDEEEDKLDEIVNRFIQYDTGKLTGADGKKALKEFQALGPDATFALIRGLNRAAGIEASCPAVTIGKKLLGIIQSTKDPELLQFARENMGAGIKKSPHMGVIKQLKFAALMRKKDIGGTTFVKDPIVIRPGDSSMRGLTIKQLSEKAGSERGDKLKAVLKELETRQGDAVIVALGTASSHYETDVQQLARDLLVKHLSRLSSTTIKEKLKSDQAEVRAAAARTVASKGLRLGDGLIDLLDDKDADVRKAAHDGLVKLAKGTDYGPKADAKDADRAEAVRQWRAWWAKQK